MKSRKNGLAARFATAVTLATLSVAGGAEAAPQSIAIPAYFYPVYPDPLWQQMADASPVVSFAVMNPANGAGAAPDSNYVSQVAALRAAGVKVLGYVYSSYAARDAALLRDDIDHYYAWYGVDGIFIDEAENHCVNQPYYADLDTYTKAKGGLGLTVINPGTVTPECFATAADILLNFEGSYTQYLAWAPLGWEAGYDPSHFWHLVYATSEADMPSAVLMSQARGAGFVYVTPDVLAPNPWDSLPAGSYWTGEMAWVQPTSGGCMTPVAKPKILVKGLDTADADDRLKFSGQFSLAGTPVVDPSAGGLRFVLSDTTGAKVDVTLPAGAYGGDPGIGWLGGDGKWSWRDDAAMPASGIAKAKVRVKSDGVTTTVAFQVTGVDGSYPVGAGSLPLTGALLLHPADPETDCATASFPGPSPSCAAKAGGASVLCK